MVDTHDDVFVRLGPWRWLARRYECMRNRREAVGTLQAYSLRLLFLVYKKACNQQCARANMAKEMEKMGNVDASLEKHEHVAHTSDERVSVTSETYRWTFCWNDKRVRTRSHTDCESAYRELDSLSTTLRNGGTPEEHFLLYKVNGKEDCEENEENEESEKSEEDEDDKDDKEEYSDDSDDSEDDSDDSEDHHKVDEEWEHDFYRVDPPYLDYPDVYTDFDDVSGEWTVCDVKVTRRQPRDLRRPLTKFEQLMRNRWESERRTYDSSEGECIGARREAKEAYPDPQELFNRAFINEVFRVRFTSAHILYTMAAFRGHSGAAYRLALMKHSRKGIPENTGCQNKANDIACEMFNKAFLKKHAGATYFVGRDYEFDNDTAKAVEYYEIASNGGFVPATYHLSALLWDEDRDRAIKLLERAAHKGHVVAIETLAGLLLRDDSHPVNTRRAYELLRKAVQRSDHPETMVKCAQMLQAGLGCSVNVCEARKLLERASKLGSAEADNMLERMASLAALSLMEEEAEMKSVTAKKKKKTKKRKGKASMGGVAVVEEEERAEVVEDEQEDEAIEEVEDKGVDDVVEETVKVSLEEFCCPISLQIMSDPVVAADGFSYERDSIERWFDKKNTSPATGEPLKHMQLIPNHQLRAVIRSLSGM